MISNAQLSLSYGHPSFFEHLLRIGTNCQHCNSTLGILDSVPMMDTWHAAIPMCRQTHKLSDLILLSSIRSGLWILCQGVWNIIITFNDDKLFVAADYSLIILKSPKCWFLINNSKKSIFQSSNISSQSLFCNIEQVMLADCRRSDIKYYQVLRTCNSPIPRVLDTICCLINLRNKVSVGQQQQTGKNHVVLDTWGTIQADNLHFNDCWLKVSCFQWLTMTQSAQRKHWYLIADSNAELGFIDPCWIGPKSVEMSVYNVWAVLVTAILYPTLWAGSCTQQYSL